MRGEDFGTDRLFDPGEIEQSLTDRFTRMAATFPERIAVRADGREVTYRTLDQESNRLAHHLLAHCGEAEEPIALLFDQGIDLVYAVLASLKAGKIYLALDPAHSETELARFVGHAEPCAILCDAQNRPLAARLGASKIGVIGIGEAHDGPDSALGLRLAPGRRAYIFYTSGSTGAPKGVVDSHRNVLHNVMRYTNSLRIVPEDRLSLVQSCAFSGTVSSLFGALLNGAAVFPFDLRRLGAGAMAAWLADEKITIFHSVPVIFEQLLAAGYRFPHLRLIRLEGDRCESRHIRRFKEHFGPGCTLVNGLGATETGIVRQFFVRPDSPVPDPVVPIGYPVEDMDVRLLDQSGIEVPDGEIGEIAVASRYLALGYWRDPERTGAAFRVDPGDAGRRIYRTGDLGRKYADGCLNHLGRKDFQTKLRGAWIDVPGVEAALNRIAGVDRVIVAVREDRPGVQRLIAYLVTAEGAKPSVETLRGGLSRELPETMIPSRYVLLDRMPTDRNEKINWRALPAPGRERPILDTPFVAPVTERQKTIADCFAKTLAIDQIGVDDDFFALGGDSLMATELLMLIDEQLGVLCPEEFLVSTPTVAGLDRSLENERSAGALVPLRPGGAGAPLFCVHGSSGYVLEYRLLARLLGTDRPVYGVQRQRGARVRRTAEAEAADVLAEIRRIQPKGPYHLCGNCYGGVIGFDVARLLRSEGQRVEFLALVDPNLHPSMASAFAPSRSVRDHWAELFQLRPIQWPGYLARRIGNYLGRIVRHVATRQRHDAAPRAKPYDGDVIFFSPGEPDSRSRWKQLIPRLQVVEIGRNAPGSSRRPHLVSEPFVHDLAKAMEAKLAAADG